MADQMLLLAIDDHLLPFKRNLGYYLSKPRVHEGPVVVPSADDPRAPDRRAAHFYGTVMHDEGRYRMWYYGQPREAPGVHDTCFVCYAESDDGITWTKPPLGQVEVGGSTQNNALALPGKVLYGATVIKEDDDPDLQRRYKLVATTTQEQGAVADRFGQPVSTLNTATSPDGLHWRPRPGWPIDVFAEHGCLFKFNGLYVVIAQGIFTGGGEGGSEHGRQGYTWVSPDFDEWLQGWGEGFMLPEPADPAQRGFNESKYDQVHMGVGATVFDNVVVGVYGLWHQGGQFEGIHPDTSGDLGLVISNDGLHFREPVSGHVYISCHDSVVTPAPGKEYPTLLCQSNGILNVGDETRIYHGRWRHAGPTADYYAETALAILPRDRWGALGLFPKESEGWVWSAPLTVPDGGCRITLNAYGAEQMRVEVSDDRFKPLPTHSGANSGTVAVGDPLASEVTWSGADLKALAGKSVRLRIGVKRGPVADPRFYAAYIDPGAV